MPIIQSEFKPAWWLKNAHLQTIWPFLIRPRYPLVTMPQRLELPDKDFIDLAWVGRERKGPLVVMLHGLGGSIDSHYAQRMLYTIDQHGGRAVLMHFRGCSGEPNRQLRSYHSGDTADLGYLLQYLQAEEPRTPLIGLGVSLGGNVLLKWLGQQQEQAIFTAAMAICVPMDLTCAANRMQYGFSRLYQWYLVRELKRHIKTKCQALQQPLPVAHLDELSSFWAFDNEVTAPLHGFQDVNDYYARASSRPDLKHITVPTHILHALDDPFMTPDVTPTAEELSPAVSLELCQHGGHVGFVTGNVPGRTQYWLEYRVVQLLNSVPQVIQTSL
jgi:hypothetical protein